MKKKLDIRDALWLIIALFLLGWLGWEWRLQSLLAGEIRELAGVEQPLHFLNANLDEASFFTYFRYGAQAKVDWPSLKPLGLNSGTKVTKSIQADTAKEAYEQLFGEGVEVVEDAESSEVMKVPVFIIRARQ
ncbi:hypothetical protein [Anatilimnocola floriformis]|uniref:hypothetical protein n=1 Tax=Anatilimnocola floriformis TaxID=2948575 RepID=UPI0020C3B12C|nr:hypothetical protein [Anatilimnocola floriformis]